MPPTLTGHGQGDGLARLVVPVLVIHRLHVVTPRVRRHRGQDDQRVLQRDGSGGGEGAVNPSSWDPHSSPSTHMGPPASPQDGGTKPCAPQSEHSPWDGADLQDFSNFLHFFT